MKFKKEGQPGGCQDVRSHSGGRAGRWITGNAADSEDGATGNAADPGGGTVEDSGSGELASLGGLESDEPGSQRKQPNRNLKTSDSMTSGW
ncbi:hypothetical protein PAMP_014778 [Pampus punctatissimus]